MGIHQKSESVNWFNVITERLRDCPNGSIWSDGMQILCKDEGAANAITDLVVQLYASQQEEMCVLTGYFDPEEDKKQGIEDRFTGWWYVSLD